MEEIELFQKEEDELDKVTLRRLKRKEKKEIKKEIKMPELDE